MEDYEVDKDFIYQILEFAPQLSLADQIKNPESPLLDSSEKVISLFQKVVGTLMKINESGFLHGDVKPANILLQDDGNLKLLDFGIARDEVNSELTQVGLAVGTPAYMSPEQAQGELLDRRSDLFSLGIVLCEETTGRHLFKRKR